MVYENSVGDRARQNDDKLLSSQMQSQARAQLLGETDLLAGRMQQAFPKLDNKKDPQFLHISELRSAEANPALSPENRAIAQVLRQGYSTMITMEDKCDSPRTCRGISQRDIELFGIAQNPMKTRQEIERIVHENTTFSGIAGGVVGWAYGMVPLVSRTSNFWSTALKLPNIGKVAAFTVGGALLVGGGVHLATRYASEKAFDEKRRTVDLMLDNIKKSG